MRPARLSQGRRRNPGTREHLVGSHHAKRAETSVNSDRSCCSWPAPPVPSCRRAGRCGPAPGAHRPPLRAHFVLIAGCRGVCSCSHVPVRSGDIARVRPRVLYCVGERRRDVVARAARPRRATGRGPDAGAGRAGPRVQAGTSRENAVYTSFFHNAFCVRTAQSSTRRGRHAHHSLHQMCEVIHRRTARRGGRAVRPAQRHGRTPSTAPRSLTHHITADRTHRAGPLPCVLRPHFMFFLARSIIAAFIASSSEMSSFMRRADRSTVEPRSAGLKVELLGA